MLKGSEWMRNGLIVVIMLLGSLLLGASAQNEQELSLILEVEEDAQVHATYIKNYLPQVEVVAVYETLFQGIAVKGNPRALKKVTKLDFVEARYPVQTYTSFTLEEEKIKVTDDIEGILPTMVNDTNYTGKGIKVGVIDTGIDYTHPDLRANFLGGYDLVDLDDDPMETTEGLKTLHGTHVAGIIAADGAMQGVAPDAELYGYRALGPGGVGTSIQVIAAMEEAIRDEVDVINLSLGNTVNGPDYPTSKAVSEASKLGVAVVVANGNAGPENWTVGAPATSQQALSVGAYAPKQAFPSLSIRAHAKKMPLQEIAFTPKWDFDRDYEVTMDQDVRGKFALLQVDPETVVEDMVTLQEEGAVAIILYEEKANEAEWMAEMMEKEFDVPVAFVSLKDGRWLQRNFDEKSLYADTVWDDRPEMVAPFSSRGPVTVSWQPKPDLIAPGVNVLSTVPGGYEALNGTSMAAPHVAGAIAVMKEAQPTWSNERIFHALKTTARPLHTESDEWQSPIEQGTGLLQLADAMETDVIIYGAPLAFGFVRDYLEERQQTIWIENLSDEEKQFRFNIPSAHRGLIWKMPQKVTVAPGKKVKVPIELRTNSILLEEGIFEEWFTIESEGEKFTLPYIVINETSNYPKVMGFSFQINGYDSGIYDYQLYVPEEVKSIKVKLYRSDSLLYEGELMELKEKDLEIGMNEGKIAKRDIDYSGEFYGLIVVELKNGELAHYDTKIILE